ncbi:hypothetical protein FB45DRAFT_1081806, partial [Roridomyces roridus]
QDPTYAPATSAAAGHVDDDADSEDEPAGETIVPMSLKRKRAPKNPDADLIPDKARPSATARTTAWRNTQGKTKQARAKLGQPSIASLFKVKILLCLTLICILTNEEVIPNAQKTAVRLESEESDSDIEGVNAQILEPGAPPQQEAEDSDVEMIEPAAQVEGGIYKKRKRKRYTYLSARDCRRTPLMVKVTVTFNSQGEGMMAHQLRFTAINTVKIIHQLQASKSFSRQSMGLKMYIELSWHRIQGGVPVKDAIKIFEVKYPNSIAVFIFDCSSAHEAYSSDALLAHKMNRGPGGKQPKMRDTIIPATGKPQSMVFPQDYTGVDADGVSLAGQAKGMEQVLRERGLLAELEAKHGSGRKVVGAAREKAMRAAKSREDEVEGDLSEAGPRGFRELTDGTFPTAQRLVPECLKAVATENIRRYFRHCWRYMDAYRQGLNLRQAAYAAKKFKSHRRIPADIMRDPAIVARGTAALPGAAASQ